MTLRLDPRYPLVWRTPDTVQIGIDHPLVVISHVGTGLEHVLSALVSGVPRSGAMMLGRRAGTSDAATAALLDALRPALVVTDEPSPWSGGVERGRMAPSVPSPALVGPALVGPALVCVDGVGPTALRIGALLRDLGLRVADPGDDPGVLHRATPGRTSSLPALAIPALAVIVGHYALEPARHGRWLRQDVPHLPVIFGDSEVRVGPLVEPGSGPCLYCLELTHLDADRAWPAIACQLLTRTAPTETRRLGIDVAARVAGLVQDRLERGRSSLAGRSLVIDAVSGLIRRREHRPHERCGCRSLPGIVIALAGTAAGGPPPTSSSRADAGPA